MAQHNPGNEFALPAVGGRPIAGRSYRASSGSRSLTGRRVSVLDLDDKATEAAVARLHDDVDAHVTSRLPWVTAWRESHPKWRSWVLALLDSTGEIRAVAPLARRQRGALVQIRCLGHDGVDQSAIVWRTPEDAVDLANDLANRLRRQQRPWTMELPSLPCESAFAAGLARQLPAVDARLDGERPIVVFDRSHAGGYALSRNLRQAEAKARNRIARAGLEPKIRWITDPQAIAERIPEIRSVHLARDIQLRGVSVLDHAEEGRFYDELLRRQIDLLELLEIRFGDDLAAYVLWIKNGPRRLVLDNRVAPCWTAYSAGQIANNVALRVAAADPDIGILDWGSGVQRYKLQSANRVIPRERLLAWSSETTRRALAARRLLLGGLRSTN